MDWTLEMESTYVILVDEMGINTTRAEHIVEEMVEKNIPLDQVAEYVGGGY